MLFNSYEFIFLFFPIALAMFCLTNGDKYKKITLISLAFYSYWNPYYTILLIASISFNYIASKLISNKLSLAISIAINILVIGYYKYFNFIIDNMNVILSSNLNNESIILPLAISFFTFQQIAYLVDNYKEKLSYGFWEYSAFVCFFPQLIAGPIVHHNQLLPQLEKSMVKIDNFCEGLFLFSVGLFKKVVIADTFGSYVNDGFDNYSNLTFIESWTTSLSYTLQLYFDFSGYCDMAMGLALVFGVRLPLNFNSPYKSRNIQEFWRRWHITLGAFLRDYIYIPLGGNRKSNIIISLNLIITFLIGGIWHGAGWTFALWGLIHGVALVNHRLWKVFNIRIPKLASILITFLFVNASWVIFRSENMDMAISILTKMISINDYKNTDADSTLILLILFGLLSVFFIRNPHEKPFKATYITLVSSIFFFVSSVILFTKDSAFLYFNF
ncbi:MBOAT family O-acyltransferase [Vibrio sonorensis]|uniref:MBOAT family O-acyltransferase n=1 Tax=Vibrio sonorensis TaxID=1004316 RepID=UPI0008D9498C|nr:MBOAT family O-acyltransferase [Vibrio sonorensis]